MTCDSSGIPSQKLVDALCGALNLEVPCSFSETDIAAIETLEIDSMHIADIRGLDCLTSLKVLTAESTNAPGLFESVLEIETLLSFPLSKHPVPLAKRLKKKPLSINFYNCAAPL